MKLSRHLGSLRTDCLACRKRFTQQAGNHLECLGSYRAPSRSIRPMRDWSQISRGPEGLPGSGSRKKTSCLGSYCINSEVETRAVCGVGTGFAAPYHTPRSRLFDFLGRRLPTKEVEDVTPFVEL